jgi:hypothetical protein
MLEQALNDLSDKDSGWWPFLWLRPAHHEVLTNRKIALMSAFYGPICGNLTALALVFATGGSSTGGIALRGVEAFAAWSLGCALLFFVLYRFTFALAWNRRARRSAPARLR